MRQTTVADRELVIYHYKHKKNYNEISKIINRSRSTVQCIIKRYKEEDRVVNKLKERSDKKLNIRGERWIVRKIKDDPRVNAPKLASEVEKYLNKKGWKKNCMEKTKYSYGY